MKARDILPFPENILQIISNSFEDYAIIVSSNYLYAKPLNSRI